MSDLSMSQFATKEAYWEARCLAAENDAMTMALRLLGEDDNTFAPETYEVMSRWRPKAMALVSGE